MKHVIFSCRLIESAKCQGTPVVEDYATQFEEFSGIARNVLMSDAGYLAIAEILDETLGILEEAIRSKRQSFA